MEIQNLPELLANNSYPGRGILLGKCDCGKAVLAYFIMGRSENSRNRVFTETDKGLITEAADPAKLTDPSLVIYTALRALDNQIIVTNGDQTDTVYDLMCEGKTFEQALRTRTFEPDPPNLTPRISGILTNENGEFSYKLSILKSNSNNEASAQRFFFEYPQPFAGEGHFISTYDHDGDPLPSFSGEPRRVAVSGGIDAFGEALWNALNADNKVSLCVKTIAPDGAVETRIYNRNNKEA